MSDKPHIVCPQCDTTNRIPATRLGEAPRCGHCHQLLFTAHPVALTGDNLQRFVDRHDIPVVVDFWATWCAPCQAMAPQYAQAAAELEPQVRLAKLDTDVAQEVASQLGIRSIPTLILFKSGREVARHAGAMGRADIVRWVRAHA